MAKKPGKNLMLYLTAERLARLGPEPAATIYSLIDGYAGHQPVPAPPATTDTPPRKSKPRKKYICDRHVRMGYTTPVHGCLSCTPSP